MKILLLITSATVLAHCAALADVDSLGKTLTYWYTFDGAIVSHGSSALKCAFDDSNNTFPTCRGEKKGWRVNPNKSYHHENVFAPNDGSFTIFMSVNPGSGQSNRYLFSLGGNESTTNLAFVLMFNSRIGVARWDRTRCGTNLRAYGLMAADEPWIDERVSSQNRAYFLSIGSNLRDWSKSNIFDIQNQKWRKMSKQQMMSECVGSTLLNGVFLDYAENVRDLYVGIGLDEIQLTAVGMQLVECEKAG